MAWTIEGSGGSQWSVATWVGRNALAYLLPALRRGADDGIASTLEEAVAGGTCEASLRELLDDARRSAYFRCALDAALADIERDGASAWDDPSAFGPFLVAVRGLRTLCRADGNELVVELATHPLNFRSDHVIDRVEAFLPTT